MELQWLRTFVDAAETLNFRKTSERLLLSQPSVTVHIRLLEEDLGIVLFHRIKNRVSLTEEGLHFKERAEQLIHNFDATVEELQSFAQGYRRKWTIAISPLMAETVLPYVLRAFTEAHPNVELVIRVEESKWIESLVEDGEVSAGLSALMPYKRTVLHEVVYEDPLLLILPRDAYDDERGPVISVEKVLLQNFIFTHHHPIFWDELLVKLRSQLTGIRTMKVTQAHIAKRFVQEGLGISFLPKSMVRRELIEGRLMEAHFDLFPLPKVATYFLARQMGALEKDFLKRIQSVYFK